MHTCVCVCVYISTHPCDDVHIKRLEKLIESFNGGDLLPAILASDHSYMFASISIAITRLLCVINAYMCVCICMILSIACAFILFQKRATADCGPQPVRNAAAGNIYAYSPTSDQTWTWIYLSIYVCVYQQATLSFRTRLRKVPPNRGRK